MGDGRSAGGVGVGDKELSELLAWTMGEGRRWSPFQLWMGVAVGRRGGVERRGEGGCKVLGREGSAGRGAEPCTYYIA